jgi:hypothetical protein
LEAFVLIQTDEETHGLAHALLGLTDVVTAEDLRGPYDAIARVQTPDGSGRLDESIQRIRAIPGVDRAVAAHLPHPSPDIEDDEAA